MEQGSTVIRFSWGSHWLDIWRTFQRRGVSLRHLLQKKTYVTASKFVLIAYANNKKRPSWILNGFSQDGGRTDFSKFRRASSSNDDHSIDPLSGRSISLDSTFNYFLKNLTVWSTLIQRLQATGRQLEFKIRIQCYCNAMVRGHWKYEN